jgi:SpoVK/Ycf46/Vps4 family AAA+-type ATPase
MAGRQLKDIMRAFRTRDEVTFRRAALELIDEQEARHHFALARDMRALLASGGGPADTVARVELPEPPKASDGSWDLIDVQEPELALDDLVLDPAIAALFADVVAEARGAEALEAAGVPPRRRLLFTGPAGTGKTSAAEALARELSWPIGRVSVESVVSSYLGETASNLRRVFEFAASNRVVLVFDEFDALGRMRDDSTEHGEIKRVVSSFLQFLEKHRGPSLIVAITNYPGLLDFALWRRFDEVAKFDLPSVHQLRQLLRKRSRSMKPRVFDVEASASALRGLPQAAAERFVTDLRRKQVLSTDPVSPEVVTEVLRGIRERPW